MPKDDRIRLQHMLDAAKEAVASARQHRREDLDKDHIGALGLFKCIEIIGEAAARLGDEIKERYSHIPWVELVAMRNRLVHVYFDVDLDQVWKAVTEDLPPLVTELEKVLGC